MHWNKWRKQTVSTRYIILIIMGAILVLAIVLFVLLRKKNEPIDFTEANVIATAKTINEMEETTETALTDESLAVSTTGEMKDENSSGVSSAVYILPESDSRIYAMEELEKLSKEQLRLARNEIFARHGRKFLSEELQTYFSAQSWYTPVYEVNEFDALGDHIFNKFEIENRKLIMMLEDVNASIPRPEVPYKSTVAGDRIEVRANLYEEPIDMGDYYVVKNSMLFEYIEGGYSGWEYTGDIYISKEASFRFVNTFDNYTFKEPVDLLEYITLYKGTYGYSDIGIINLKFDEDGYIIWGETQIAG